MKRGPLVILLMSTLLAILAAAAGCAPGKQAVRAEKPSGVAVRLPVVESPKVSLSAEEQVRPGPLSEPKSVGDEYSGRWLTLIEVTVTPPEPEVLPSPGPVPPRR
ncbi:MAG TPA: hypothetical protein VK863_00640 [Candidatus Limnocylindrales bacterium]|nr:hypothetical protein [Candidatus Limnocylindrales bacterium]